MIFETGAPPAKVDLDVLATMTAADFGGFAPNPGHKLRNQVEDTRTPEKASAPLVAPKFLSEKAREVAKDSNLARRASDGQEALGGVTLGGGLKAEVPVMYRNVEIKYSRFGVDDFDFEYAITPTLSMSKQFTLTLFEVLQQNKILGA